MAIVQRLKLGSFRALYFATMPHAVFDMLAEQGSVCTGSSQATITIEDDENETKEPPKKKPASAEAMKAEKLRLQEAEKAEKLRLQEAEQQVQNTTANKALPKISFDHDAAIRKNWNCRYGCCLKGRPEYCHIWMRGARRCKWGDRCHRIHAMPPWMGDKKNMVVQTSPTSVLDRRRTSVSWTQSVKWKKNEQHFYR